MKREKHIDTMKPIEQSKAKSLIDLRIEATPNGMQDTTMLRPRMRACGHHGGQGSQGSGSPLQMWFYSSLIHELRKRTEIRIQEYAIPRARVAACRFCLRTNGEAGRHNPGPISSYTSIGICLLSFNSRHYGQFSQPANRLLSIS